MKTDYVSEIQAELDRLDGLKSQKATRERTIRAIAQGSVNGWSKQEVLDRKDTVSPRTYYSRGKDWYNNALYREVEENVIRLYVHRDGEQREEAAEAEAGKRHAERAALLRKGKAKLVQLLEKMDIEGATASQVASLLKAVLDQERTEFGETPPTEIDHGWREALPSGGTVGDAEAAMRLLSEAMAAGELGTDLIDQDEEE